MNGLGAQSSPSSIVDPNRDPTRTRFEIDEPLATAPVDPLCFLIRGWIWIKDSQPEIRTIEAWVGSTKIGQTAVRYVRPDVNSTLTIPADTQTGFEIFAHHANSPFGGEFELELRVRDRSGTILPYSHARRIRTITQDYRTHHFGVLLDRNTTAIQGHNNVFATGPSDPTGSPELAGLIRRYLGSPPKRVIDIGCGVGSYGRSLLAEGYEWMGIEVDPSDCSELTRLGLPHRHTDGKILPFGDNSFDSALCIEVLEHIEDPRHFLREVQRVAPRQVIVSVPNCELLGYLWEHLAAPWHMLESTHVNFFTRWSLGTLLREFYPEVELRFYTPYPLRTHAGTQLHYQLLAIGTAS